MKYSSKLPHTSVDWQKFRSRQGRDAIVAFLLAGLIFVTSYGFFSEQSLQEEVVGVVMIAETIETPRPLKETDLKIERLPRKALPEKIYTDTDTLIGQIISHKVVKNHVVTPSDFLEFLDPDSQSLLVNLGEQGVVLPGVWFISPMPKLKKKDQVVIWASLVSSEPAEGTKMIVSGAEVLDVLTPKDAGSPKQVLLGLSEAELASVIQARTNNLNLVMTIHGVSEPIQYE